MSVPTQVRVGRATACLLARQAAKGTIATVFTGASATTLRRSEDLIPIERPWSEDDDCMTSTGVAETAARFRLPEAPAGSVRAHCTPASARFLLRNNFGSSSYAIVPQIPATEWLTLAYIDDTATGATQNLVRVRDVWFHRVTITSDTPTGFVEIVGDYAGIATAVQALNAGGVTLPAAPMAASDNNVFAPGDVTFVRDPAALNVEIPQISHLEIEFDQRLGTMWDMMSQQQEVWKAGLLRARVRMRGTVGDETWAILTDSRAGTKRRSRPTCRRSPPSIGVAFSPTARSWSRQTSRRERGSRSS